MFQYLKLICGLDDPFLFFVFFSEWLDKIATS